ncbi:gastrula zinc finger protein XlCGF28.1-like [Silurus asotus]|uniref:Gastrula zinc finger protein XlCGF28.1-like n=1 Tax=Silurus asotus TaxID=30991 RepID=A0AAD5A762_SILAS|nr:gastrula zinc finger protein XlCGF28.1-like [Silurus asotus]
MVWGSMSAAEVEDKETHGPGGVSPSCLKACADQLAPIFTYILNRLLELCEVPSCLKLSTCSPVPKKPSITGLNDYRPVTLTSVVTKIFKQLVLAHLMKVTEQLLDSLQFDYQANRSVDDTVNMGLHYILQHFDCPGTYARILFVDFSSALNTINSGILHSKLLKLTILPAICQWITSFLTGRKQQMRLGDISSGIQTVSTGTPQGCVLSPLLFSLYMNDCTSSNPTVKLLKFADETKLIELQDGDESAYEQEVKRLVLWCSQSNLELNTLKTVEMIVDFRKYHSTLLPPTISKSPVSAVENFLGPTISQDLKWKSNINPIFKNGHQRMYFLCQLRKFGLPQELLMQFYSAVIESVLCSSITIWFGAAKKQDRNRLQQTVKTSFVLLCPLFRTCTIQGPETGQEISRLTLHTLDTAPAFWQALQNFIYQN